MYWNNGTVNSIIDSSGLTLTWDVLKFNKSCSSLCVGKD